MSSGVTTQHIPRVSLYGEPDCMCAENDGWFPLWYRLRQSVVVTIREGGQFLLRYSSSGQWGLFCLWPLLPSFPPDSLCCVSARHRYLWMVTGLISVLGNVGLSQMWWMWLLLQPVQINRLPWRTRPAHVFKGRWPMLFSPSALFLLSRDTTGTFWQRHRSSTWVTGALWCPSS